MWARTSYLAEKYRLLVWLGFLLLLAFGFDFKTPAQAMRTLQSQIDTLKDNRDSLFSRQKEIRHDVKDLKFLICLSHKEQSICNQ